MVAQQSTIFAILIISHAMMLMAGNDFANDRDISGWAELIGSAVLAICALGLLAP